MRKIVHDACPEVQETLKWSMPHFDYKGMMCGMAAFKHHCTFGFWKAALIFGSEPLKREAVGHFGRITAISDLPPEEALLDYVRQAAALYAAGVKAPRRAKSTGKPAALEIPGYFQEALRKNAKARKTFNDFNPSKQKEYVEWLTEAKREETRKRRLSTSIQWLAEGKPRMWKYQREGGPSVRRPTGQSKS